MKKVSLEKIEKLLVKAKKAHDAKQKEYLSQAIKNKREYNVKPFNNEIDYSGLQFKSRSNVFKGCNGKAMFDPSNIHATSYKWWTFVTVIKNRVVFNNHNYSVTTNGHQSSVRSLMRTLGIKIDLMVNIRNSLSKDSFETKALESMYTDLYTLEIELSRKNSRPETNRDRKKQVKSILRDIVIAKKLGAKFSKEKQVDLKKYLVSNEVKRIEEMKIESLKRKELAKQSKSILELAFTDGNEKSNNEIESESETVLNNAFTA